MFDKIALSVFAKLINQYDYLLLARNNINNKDIIKLYELLHICQVKLASQHMLLALGNSQQTSDSFQQINEFIQQSQDKKSQKRRSLMIYIFVVEMQLILLLKLLEYYPIYCC
ncbi:unnamed protein product [Paramecium octaurelia]|uniref:Uncharacterized protein n=1 Tax=Paramecium octaurelia TaxID=43137 RepID=A0A8S1UBA5_PAROT|nr:unnamed protein product [Paramecium octaurelia]